MTWLLLAVAVLAEVAATLALRASRGLGRKKWIVAALYATGFVLFTATLANGMPVGVAYGVWAAGGVACTSVGARLFFKDRVTKRMGAGLALIAAGVLVIGLGSPGR